MGKCKVLFHQTPCTKTFIFATAFLTGEENLTAEYFSVVEDETKNIHTDGLTMQYPKHLLLSLSEFDSEPDPIEFGIRKAADLAKNNVALIYMKKFENGNDPRFFFVYDHFNLSEASPATIALNAPDEKPFSFVYQTGCDELKKVLDTAFMLKKSIRINPVSKI